MNTKRDLSLINAVASAFLAYFFTIPFHEFIHFVTFYIYGHKVKYYSAGSVGPIYSYDLHELSPFHRVMAAGGSASITNAIIGIVLFAVLIKVRRMAPFLRLFLTQLAFGQLLEGFGYFLIGGLFATGDWGNVFSYFDKSPGTVTVMRIILSVIGVVSSFILLYLMTYIPYDFIEDPSDKTQRRNVAVRVNLTLGLTGVIVGFLGDLQIPEVRNGWLPLWLFLLYKLMWVLVLVAFFYVWGGIMAKPPAESRQKCAIPADPHPVLWGIALVLILIDIFIFGPGIYL